MRPCLPSNSRSNIASDNDSTVLVNTQMGNTPTIQICYWIYKSGLASHVHDGILLIYIFHDSVLVDIFASPAIVLPRRAPVVDNGNGKFDQLCLVCCSGSSCRVSIECGWVISCRCRLVRRGCPSLGICLICQRPIYGCILQNTRSYMALSRRCQSLGIILSLSTIIKSQSGFLKNEHWTILIGFPLLVRDCKCIPWDIF